MSSGWICLHRGLIDWEWYDDINTCRLFIHCLLRANHSPKKWRGIDIKRGQFWTSLDTLSKETGLSASKIRTSISKLEKTGEIASKGQAGGRMITISNYDTYQENDKPDSKSLASQSQANDKPIATNNNDNNENNNNNGTKKREVFAKPSLEEVQTYFHEIGSTRCLDDGERFFDHFESNNWKVGGKAKMKDWKASVRNWNKRNKDKQNEENKRNGITSAATITMLDSNF